MHALKARIEALRIYGNEPEVHMLVKCLSDSCRRLNNLDLELEAEIVFAILADVVQKSYNGKPNDYIHVVCDPII